MVSRRSVVLCAILMSSWAGLWAQPVPTAATSGVDLATVELVRLPGVTAELGRAGTGLRVTFDKPGDERRLVALEMRAPPPTCKALTLQYRLTADPALTTRFTLIAYEGGGGAWFRSGTPLAAGPDVRDLRFSLQGLRQTAFSQDASGTLEWDQVERLWIGLVVDGKGQGVFEVSKLLLSSEASTATEPVSILKADAGQWSLGADPAVTDKDLQTVDADGAKCLKLSFRFPGGKHMYCVPAQPVDEQEFSAYAGLSLTYRATVPAGVDGLLVCVHEGGGQFVATPPPPASGEWVSVTIPWTAFPLAAWSKDDNGRLDIDAITQVNVGVHGTASGEGGTGEILLKALELVPAAK